MDSKAYILKTAISLFSKRGFDGVSMRYLAKTVNMSTAAVYHHFPNKQSLYLEAIHFAFAKQAKAFDEVWLAELSPADKLREFVYRLTQLLSSEVEFRRLMQREMLDADENRMQLLAKDVFYQQFIHLMTVIEQLDTTGQAHFSALSVIALVNDLIQMQPLSRHLPGWRTEHEQIDYIVEHVMNLLIHGI